MNHILSLFGLFCALIQFLIECEEAGRLNIYFD